MVSRVYVCPLQGGVPASTVAQGVSAALGGAPVTALFESTQPWVSDADAAAAAATTLVGEGDAVIDATLPDLPFGIDALRLHTLAGPHLRAAALAVVDAASLDADALAAAAATVSQRFDEVHLPLIGIVALGASATPHSSAVPVIALDASACADDVAAAVAQAVAADVATPLSPVAYQRHLVARAASDRRTIVLPESSDERILKAAAQLVALDAVNLILLGEADTVAADAKAAGVDLTGVDVVSPKDPDRLERYARELALLREKKGMTYDKALEQLHDVSYFATMMVQMGEADGMVSGAIHTTAETIRPALQIIKTAPGTSTVSGAFLMLTEDRPYLFADCAVTIDPSAAQLADITVASGRTASAFGIDPRVALISYSTLGSGTGPSVEKVEEAVSLAREADPALALDGPLQFDAAVDRQVASKKAPGSPVAGQATVFIFNHLDVGNCTYKAVQRLAGAVAVGPILQGLKKPVNDLSRGALVEDIVNTVIITAIQAQGQAQ